MRNPDRLDKFYEEMCKLHKENFPDWRFSQFMINFYRWLRVVYETDGFYYEEEPMMEMLIEFVERIKKGGDIHA